MHRVVEHVRDVKEVFFFVPESIWAILLVSQVELSLVSLLAHLKDLSLEGAVLLHDLEEEV